MFVGVYSSLLISSNIIYFPYHQIVVSCRGQLIETMEKVGYNYQVGSSTLFVHITKVAVSKIAYCEIVEYNGQLKL